MPLCQAPPVIEWHREKVLKEAGLKAIMMHVLELQPPAARKAPHSPLELRIGHEASITSVGAEFALRDGAAAEDTRARVART